MDYMIDGSELAQTPFTNINKDLNQSDTHLLIIKKLRKVRGLVDLERLNPKEYFKNYDFYEEVDPKNPTKIYETEFYIYDFGNGRRVYQNKRYKLIDFNGNGKRHYIVAKEYPTLWELRNLIPYCTCEYHSSSFFRRLRICRECSGCLTLTYEPEMICQDVLVESRIKMNTKKESWMNALIALFSRK